jgi:hypothetical protein
MVSQVGFRACRLTEVMSGFMYEIVFSDDRAADDDVNKAVDNIRVQAVKCFIRTRK